MDVLYFHFIYIRLAWVRVGSATTAEGLDNIDEPENNIQKLAKQWSTIRESIAHAVYITMVTCLLTFIV